jgi:hypothetical protein
LGDNFQFGGGASESAMHPVVLAITLAALVAILFLRRNYAIAAVTVPVFLTSFGEQRVVGGLHLFVIRIIILGGMLRLAKARSGVAFTALEKTFFVWAFFRGVTFILLFKQMGAVTAQLAFWLDAYGGYMLFRYAIRDKQGVIHALKVLSGVAAVLAVCMSFEFITRVNLFNYISSHSVTPWIRDGKVRAQGTFANSITAGTFGATLFPLFVWLWRTNASRFWGAIGVVSATGITVASVASTAFSAYLGGIFALCMWPLRKQMREVRWGIVFATVVLAMVMKAPIWYLVAKVDFVGGHGWDRGYLIDQFAQHWTNWWLLGTADNASWGNDTWDACNQFVAEGLGGGLVSLVLFIMMLSRSFSMIGIARAGAEGNPQRTWFFWCFGAALFSHVIAFFGIDYFDNLRVWWFLFLALISAACAEPDVRAEPVRTAASRERWFVDENSHTDAAEEVPVWVTHTSCETPQTFGS